VRVDEIRAQHPELPAELVEQRQVRVSATNERERRFVMGDLALLRCFLSRDPQSQAFMQFVETIAIQKVVGSSPISRFG
jgi:hypothetical protein